ncbi:putative dsba oxidoreductase family protein [Octadecabacter arcticus 238]|uniref:Putative dsba oxidoreductase family protein n=1 Tax=Octadecabacter arcticus 238 TaxID=391616 RepID=M9RI79_9RHOB|nr:DsbA family oxidoreductase [Octadecabacter arcticus]AGI71897.1 putative dsba oxidoreductase family protein [Octadecabacter arcticus 238]
MTTTPLRIDIISDVVCPWCIVGYRQLKKAAEASGTAVDIHWHPFELNPSMPAEGQNMVEHIMEKYGSSQAESHANRDRLSAIGEDLDFTFLFADDMRMHNTFDTHQLLHWATLKGKGDDLKQALFIAHFTHCRNLSDPDVLATIASEVGLDRAEAEAILIDQRFSDQVRAEEKFWTQQGITGVPAMVFDRQHLVTGAQGVDNYANILSQLTQGGGASE